MSKISGGERKTENSRIYWINKQNRRYITCRAHVEPQPLAEERKHNTGISPPSANSVDKIQDHLVIVHVQVKI